ncbi:response regulator [Paenibacillus thalictri]|nr:response regulator [Paenibacillus thalictri]
MDSLVALVIDDETESREGLKQIIPWQQLGVHLTLEAGNGKEALETILEYKPDLIFTDLMMPFLSGIELMKELHRLRYKGKIIVITGYDDFQFAREALRLGAADYILKPFRTPEVLPIVSQCIEEIRLSRLGELQLQQQQEKYTEALGLLQQKIVKDIITGSVRTGDKIQTKLEQVSLGWMLNHPLTVASIEIDNLLGESSAQEKELLLFAIGNVTHDSIGNQVPFYMYYNHSDRWILILGSGSKSKVADIAGKLIENIGRYVKLAVTIGVGPVCRVEGLPKSYVASMEALEYKTILGGNQVLFSEEVSLHPPTEDIHNSHNSDIEQEMLSILKTGALIEQAELRAKLTRLVQSWGVHKKETLHHRMFEWLLKLERQLKAHNPNLNVIGSETLKHWKTFSRFDTLDGIIHYSITVLQQMTFQNHEEQKSQLGHITRKALQLIEERFTDNELTLSAVADKVYVSSVWLSHLLKEKTGKTFLEIVTELRISLAKQLLQDVSLKAYEVAERVGYKDTDYFTKQFKKHTGRTPSEYRSQT